MNDDIEFDRFRLIVADNFDSSAEKITRETTAADIDGWDSVSHATLILAIEENYAFQFADDEIFSFNNVGSLFDRAMQLWIR
jgi:acyl carrier protein